MGLPKQGFVQQVESLHLIYDGVGVGSVAGAQALSALEQGGYGFGGNNLSGGRRSGVVGATPWNVARVPQPSPFSDWGSGAAVTFTAGPPPTLTDTGKAWAVNSQAGRRVESISAGVRTFFVVASNTATVLTGQAAVGWSNGTPAANAVYVVFPAPFGPHAEGQGVATTWAPAGGRQALGAAFIEGSDNWYKAQMEGGNTESV